MQAELREALDTADEVDVIVSLREQPDAAEATRATRAEAIRRLLDTVIARSGSDMTRLRRLRHTPAFSGRITRAALEQLQIDPDVQYIQLDGVVHGHLEQAVPAVGADQLQRRYGLTGRGVRIATFDTGIELTHPDLRDAVVAQRCFARFSCGLLAADQGESAQDDNGHGTYVAGVLASRGMVSAPGYAPEAKLIVIKVMNSNNSGQQSDWLAGLDWLYENLAELDVHLVNVSLGTDLLYGSDCDQREAGFAKAIANLTRAGVTMLAASGNNGSGTMLPAPACNTGVIAVGASYDDTAGPQPANGVNYAQRFGPRFANCKDEKTDAHQIACFSNTNVRLDLVAPGAPVVSDYLGGKTEVGWGSSAAVAAATGVAAQLLQCNPSLTPAEIKRALVTTDIRSADPKNMLEFPVLRAQAALRVACPTLDPGDAPSAGSGGSAGAAGGGGGGPAPEAGSGGTRERSAASLGQKYRDDAYAVATSPDPAQPRPAGTSSSVDVDATAGRDSNELGADTNGAVSPAESRGCSCRAAGARAAGRGEDALLCGLIIGCVLYRRKRPRMR